MIVIRLPTPARLWLAVVACLAPMGLAWSTTVQGGTTIPGDCGYSDGPYCVPDAYLPGSAHVTLVSQSPVRLFLFGAAVMLAACALKARTAGTRGAARAASVSLAVAAVLAAAHGAPWVLVCAAIALALTAPLVWPLGRFGRFGARSAAR